MARTVVALMSLLGLLAISGYTYRASMATCVVGVYGADASFTVSGWRAPQACKAMIAADPGTLYARQTPPTEGVVCEFDRQHQHLVVRDAGMLMLIGRAACARVAQQAQPVR